MSTALVTNRPGDRPGDVVTGCGSWAVSGSAVLVDTLFWFTGLSVPAGRRGSMEEEALQSADVVGVRGDQMVSDRFGWPASSASHLCRRS
jgi:hypothetical protein